MYFKESFTPPKLVSTVRPVLLPDGYRGTDAQDIMAPKLMMVLGVMLLFSIFMIYKMKK